MLLVLGNTGGDAKDNAFPRDVSERLAVGSLEMEKWVPR